MEEQLISFEVAKLAKKKGYILGCNYWYNFSGLLCGKFENPHIPANGKFPSYSAPTQSLLQKWLREVHGIHINVFLNSFSRWCIYSLIVNGNEITTVEMMKYNDYTTYEEALEFGLLESLKLLNL